MDEFEQTQARLKRPGSDGWWDRVIPQLDEDRAERLEAAGLRKDISHRAISIVLNGWGFEVTQAQVGHWRRSVLGR